MEKKYIIRAIGGDEVSVSDPMTKKEAEKALAEKYRAFMDKHDFEEGGFYDRCLDMDAGRFEITDEEYYQQAEILPVNDKAGIAYVLEEIRRVADEASIYDTKYHYDLTDSGVSDCAYQIKELIKALEAELDANPFDLLTEDQREQVYRKKKREHMLKEAKDLLFGMAGYSEADGDTDDNREARNCFAAQFDFTIAQAINPKSKYYVLGRVVELFEAKENNKESNFETLGYALQDALHEMSEQVSKEECADD